MDWRSQIKDLRYFDETLSNSHLTGSHIQAITWSQQTIHVTFSKKCYNQRSHKGCYINNGSQDKCDSDLVSVKQIDCSLSPVFCLDHGPRLLAQYLLFIGSNNQPEVISLFHTRCPWPTSLKIGTCKVMNARAGLICPQNLIYQYLYTSSAVLQPAPSTDILLLRLPNCLGMVEKINSLIWITMWSFSIQYESLCHIRTSFSWSRRLTSLNDKSLIVQWKWFRHSTS